jgi:hypothetical protein
MQPNLTADQMERLRVKYPAPTSTGVSAPRYGQGNVTGTAQQNTGTNFYTNAQGQPSYFGLNTWEQLGQQDPAKLGQSLADQIQQGGAAGSGGDNAYTRAIRMLQQRLSSGGYGGSFDRLSTLLGSTADTAGGRINAATEAALQSLRGVDPMAAYQYSATPTQIPQTALGTYLNSIGAGTGGVDAGRQLLQGMIDAQTAQAGQYSTAAQQAFDLQRQAAQQALVGNQQYAQSQLASYRQAQEMAIAQAKEAERKAIEDKILEYALRGGRV